MDQEIDQGDENKADDLLRANELAPPRFPDADQNSRVPARPLRNLQQVPNPVPPPRNSASRLRTMAPDCKPIPYGSQADPDCLVQTQISEQVHPAPIQAQAAKVAPAPSFRLPNLNCFLSCQGPITPQDLPRADQDRLARVQNTRTAQVYVPNFDLDNEVEPAGPNAGVATLEWQADEEAGERLDNASETMEEENSRGDGESVTRPQENSGHECTSKIRSRTGRGKRRGRAGNSTSRQIKKRKMLTGSSVSDDDLIGPVEPNSGVGVAPQEMPADETARDEPHSAAEEMGEEGDRREDEEAVDLQQRSSGQESTSKTRSRAGRGRRRRGKVGKPASRQIKKRKTSAGPSGLNDDLIGAAAPIAEVGLQGLPADEDVEERQDDASERMGDGGAIDRQENGRESTSKTKSRTGRGRRKVGNPTSRQIRRRESSAVPDVFNDVLIEADVLNGGVAPQGLPADEEAERIPEIPRVELAVPPPLQNRPESPEPPFENEEEQKEFARLPALQQDPNDATPHPKRDHSGKCVYCNKQTSPHAEKYTDFLKNFRKKKIRCGHREKGSEQCKIYFHVACIMEDPSLSNFDPQYYTLPYHFKKLVCPDHICQICHTDQKMRTAREGKLLKVRSQCRSFHVGCRPAGSILLEDRTLDLPNKITTKDFEGVHCPACSVCGKEEREDNVLERCKNCLHSFHVKCKKWNGELCRRCTLDEQTEYEKPVLVEHNGFFRIGKCIQWEAAKDSKTIRKDANFGKEGFVAVRLDNRGKVLIKELLEVQRVPTVTAYATYITISQTYQTMSGAARTVELNVLKNALRARDEEFEPSSVPDFNKELVFHDSFLRYTDDQEAMARIAVACEVSDKIGLASFGKKGRGVIALDEIPEGTKLVEYVGEVVSEEEVDKRQMLLDRSEDQQRLYYIYKTKMEVQKEGERMKEYEVGIDAATHHNISGCKPNCRTIPTEDETDGDVQFHKLVIWTTEVIKKDTELTIDYQWLGFDCLCRAPNCRNPAPPKNW